MHKWKKPSLKNNPIYHFQMNRKKRSKLYVRMGLACLVYIAGLYGYEFYSGQVVSEYFRSIYILSFCLSSLALFYIAWWHLKNPATYQATITAQRFSVDYPDSSKWSFDVSIADIDRFEYRQFYSGIGRGTVDCGIVLNNGNFHEIVMNYGNSVNKMHAVIRGIKPGVSFTKRINKIFSVQ